MNELISFDAFKQDIPESMQNEMMERVLSKLDKSAKSEKEW